MNASNSYPDVCAPSATEWHRTDWSACHKAVRRLQARIVKASQGGRRGKVKALQRLLTHSYSGKAMAVRRVTENQGRRTPGVDGITWSIPEAKATAVKALRNHGYRPRPLRRDYIPKPRGGKRPIGIPTLMDRAMQALHLLALEPVAETTADLNSYGFRPQRSCADAVAHCFQILSKQVSPAWILKAEIKGYFDNISHDWLFANISMNTATLRKWLMAGVIEDGIFSQTVRGMPQGGVISPVLANMALDGLQEALRKRFKRHMVRGQQVNPMVNLVRYTEGFIITGAAKELLENEVKPLVEQFLAERGLELSQRKTRVTHIEEGFDFLGQNIRKYDGVLLIKPSKKSIKQFWAAIRAVIRKHKMADQRHIIRHLNPIIRGWADYHQHVVSSQVFNRLDHLLWRLLWRWGRRRHPNKGRRWVLNRYFHRVGNYNRTFAAPKPDEGKTNEYHSLRRLAETKIVRHVKIRSEVNPFDPKWDVYLEKRLNARTKNTLQGRRQLFRMWLAQGGRCPHCGLPISKESGWDNHHRVPKRVGGRNDIDNRALLHPGCHHAVHALGIKVAKPGKA